MISVDISWFDPETNASVTLGNLKIQRITEQPYDDGTSELAGYSVQIAVNRGTEVGFYQRQVELFPRKAVNVLGLLRAALNQLGDDELELIADEGDPSNLARRLERSMRSIQAQLD